MSRRSWVRRWWTARRHRFLKDPLKFLLYDLADRKRTTVKQLLDSGMGVEEFVDWLGFYPYKNALQNQAIQRARVEAEAKRGN